MPDISQILAELPLINHRTNINASVKRVPHLQGGQSINDGLAEALVNSFLTINRLEAVQRWPVE